MEQQPRAPETQAEQDRPELAWPDSLVRYEPTPERLDDLPVPAFNLEQMDADQIAGLLAGLEKASHLLTPKEKRYKYEEDYNEAAAHEGQASIRLIDNLLQRDIKCLAARNLEKVEEIVFSLAAHPDGYARGTSPELLRSLYRFEGDTTEGRRRVLETLVELTQDDELVVQEGAEDVISEIVWNKEVDKQTARYLQGSLDDGHEWPPWIWE